MKRAVLPINNHARSATVGKAWAVVHSVTAGQFYLEELAEAVEKNFRSFSAAAGEDWQIIGIFASLGEAHDAISKWIGCSGVKRAREGKVL